MGDTYTLAAVVAMLSVFGLGMSFSLLGSLSVKIMPRLQIDQGKFGTLVSTFMSTCVVASVVIGMMLDRWGYKGLAIVGFVALALAILSVARASTYGLTSLACLLLGVGAMCLNTTGNVLGPKILFEGKNQAAASNLMNVFFGLGLFLTPMLLSFLLRKAPYEKAVSVLAIIALIPVLVAIVAGFPAAPAGFTLEGVKTVLAQPVVVVAALILFCYISLEVSLSNWIPPFGKEVISKAGTGLAADAVDASAQRMLSAFAVAMMIGRLAAS
ncbi:MFS transporter, partial [Candidatus Sumerlaeota bacterium]|nr:MFS transporter [Candidatus Sumerlaeota bacterium]